MNRAHDYVHQQLAATGWVLCSVKWAAVINPGLYGNGQLALPLETGTIANRLHHLGCKPYRVNFGDGSEAVCWSRSPANLAQRIEWLAGYLVDQVSPILSRQHSTQKPMPGTSDKKRDAKLEELSKMAAEDPPSHDCRRRDEILAARRELEKMGGAR